MRALVSLLTDFGEDDTYVGQLKAAVLRVAPHAQLVDLTHRVPPQDVRAGAFLLWTAVEAFPAGALHLAVVDPGVGSARRAVAAQSRRGDVLVGPDNGLLVPALERLGGLARAVELSDERYWGPARSSTFHGRDVFAPAVGHLAAGVALEALGRPLDGLEGDAHPFPAPRVAGGALEGEVLHVDVYGNLVTNVPAALLPPRFDLEVGALRVRAAPQPHYQAVAPGEPLALVGSAGLLEVSVRDGNAAQRAGRGRGAAVRLVDVP